MSKFGVQQLFAGKVISLLGYCSRKVGWASALVGWFGWWGGIWLVVALSMSDIVAAQVKVFSGSFNANVTSTRLFPSFGNTTCTWNYLDSGLLTIKISTAPSQDDFFVNAVYYADIDFGDSTLIDGVSSVPSITCPPMSSGGKNYLTDGVKNGNTISWLGYMLNASFSISLTQETPNHLEGTMIYSGIDSYTTDNRNYFEGTFSVDLDTPTTEIQILSLTSKYSDGVHYLDGIDHDVTYKAKIDWGEQEPGTVSFITPTGTKDVSATGNTAEQTFNMGKDFGVCGKLKVVATSKDGKKSPEKEADFTVMSSLPLSFLLLRIEEGNNFYYAPANLGEIDFKFFDEGIKDGRIPEDIPFFGKKGFAFRYLPKVEFKVESDKGKASLGLKTGSPLVKLKIFGDDFSLTPKLSVKNQFTSCQWGKWEGELGVSGSAAASQSWPFLIPTPVPIPIYVKASIVGSVNTSLAIKDIDFSTTAKPKLVGKLGVDSNIRGSLGVGADDFLSAEGWVKGGGKFVLQYPTPENPPLWAPNLEKFDVYLEGGLAAQVLIWKIENALLECKWDLITDAKSCNFPVPANRSKPLVQPTLIARDYLNHPNYATFRTSTRGLRDTTPAPVQTVVFPYSDANTSGSNNALYATWLSDNPARAAVNRTQVVFSTWNGTDWTNPQPIADDGTADFHPKILAFSDNSALATWEDTKTTLAETAQLEDMLQAMEISVSSYNPQTQQWTGTQRLTDNAFLDRSPKLAGKTTGNAIVTWISNAANDIMGSADKPNQLWSASYANNSWNTPQQVANIPYPILKYNPAFDGQNGYVVLSVDTDGDLTTIEDHELFQLTLTNGVWSALTRLTTDTLADDNPQLGLDPNGQVVLTWLKNNEISSVVNFDLNTRAIVRTDASGYSSNLADFKLAQATDGKLAIVWAEPSAEHSSDLHALFYNPTGNVWGGLRQLTADSETEKRITATFFGTDTLVALYNRSQVGDVSTSTSPTTSPKVETPVAVYTDLYMLKHTLRAIDFTKIDLPELGAIEGDTFAFDPAGNLTDTQAILSGGISVNGGPFKNLITFQDNLEHGEDAEPVTLKGIIIPDPKHDGKSADIFAFGEYTSYGDDLNDTTCPTQVANPEAVPFYVMESLPKNYVTWEGAKTPSSIPAFLYKNVMLKSGEAQEFILFEGPFDARGCLSISFGYRLQDSGVVVYNHHTATVDNSIGVTVRKK